MAKVSDAERARMRAEYPDLAEAIDYLRSSGYGIKGLTIYRDAENIEDRELLWGDWPPLDPPNWAEIELKPHHDRAFDREANPHKYTRKAEAERTRLERQQRKGRVK